jgi:hypothetical protein
MPPAKPYVYVTCPSCRRPIKQPFPRGCGTVPHVHNAPGCGARLLVTVDPHRHGHSAREIGAVSFEDAITQASAA